MSRPIDCHDSPARGESDGRRLLLVALAATVLFHGGLLPFTHTNTYDAFIHMFFGDHYNRSWFDPWEPRWYTGFTTTSYPPGTHMAMGALMHLVPLRAAFVLVQLAGLLLLTLGVYRFAKLWVAPRAAGYAAICLVLASSISETVHLFGQLPTIFSLGVFLNGMPYVYAWIVAGGGSNFAAAVIFAAATTAAHHVTTIFGGVLFVGPLALQALLVVHMQARGGGFRRLRALLPPLGRGTMLAFAMIGSVALTVFPYWYWSISDPITQVPIPHGSRESFLARPDLGIMFFLIPWGVSLLFLPYAAYKSMTTRLWPLGLSVLLCFVLGTGGTTPVPRALLRGAFDILTLDRFTFWGSILILPFIGLMLDGLLHGKSRDAVRAALGAVGHRIVVGGIFVSMAGLAVFAAVLPTIQPTQPRFVDPQPITRFLAEDEHDRWRYLTLGFGDQFAFISANTTALSVDGNYHSARRLPDLTRYSVERLENAKYQGVPGLGSLRQFLENAEQYHLKYVFSNDAFYDPLLYFSGWSRLNRLQNGVVVWEKPDISPLPLLVPRREIPRAHMLMWGILPPAALLSAALVLAVSGLRRRRRDAPTQPALPRIEPFARPVMVRWVVLALATLLVLAGIGAATAGFLAARRVVGPEIVIERYFDALDFRRFEGAYALLDPATRGSLEEARFAWRWRGGLLASYGKLSGLAAERLGGSDDVADWSVRLDWLTALDLRTETRRVRTVRREGRWYIAPMDLRPEQTPVRLQRDTAVAWNVVGRRQPRPATDLHRDRLDRPRIAIHGAALVERAGRYAVVGQITNADSDPAAVSLFARLTAGDEPLASQAAGRVNGQRLLPAESAGFRIDFDGVLSLEHAIATDAFDPELFIPPEFARPPEAAAIEGRALVAGKDLYRGIALNALRVELDGGGQVLSGLAVNTGTEIATIARVNVLLYGANGRPLWAEAGFVDTNIYPGQSTPFAISLPRCHDLRLVGTIPDNRIVTNGSSMQADLTAPGSGVDTLPLDPRGGCASARLHVTAMIHDPLF